MSLRTRNGAVLFALQSATGTATGLSGTTDAVLGENAVPTDNFQNVQTNEYTGSLDNRGPIVGGDQASYSIDVYLKGADAAATAPEFGTLLQVCGWAQTLTTGGITSEACGGSGSTTTAVLGASAASGDDTYNGMPISFTGDVTGSSFITDYVGSTKVATLATALSTGTTTGTNYVIPPNVLYTPTSSSIPVGTLGVYNDGLLTKLSDVRGTFTLSIDAAGAGKFTFTMGGKHEGRSDASVPTCTYVSARPPIWKNNVCKINRASAAVSSLSIDNGNTVIYPPDPEAAQGFGTALITERAITGSLDPDATLVATRDIFTALQAGTQQIIHATLGSVAGNRVGITIPLALFTADGLGDRQGLLTEQVNFSAIGQDSGLYLCFY